MSDHTKNDDLDFSNSLLIAGLMRAEANLAIWEAELTAARYQANMQIAAGNATVARHEEHRKLRAFLKVQELRQLVAELRNTSEAEIRWQPTPGSCHRGVGEGDAGLPAAAGDHS